MDKYSLKIINFLNNPKFQKILENQTHSLELKSPICGDPLRINLFLENNIIKDISYTFNGCGLNVAIIEIMCEYSIGKNIKNISLKTIEELKIELDFPSQKNHCVQLVIHTFTELLKMIENN